MPSAASISRACKPFVATAATRTKAINPSVKVMNPCAQGD
jgi:hypothetical protein